MNRPRTRGSRFEREPTTTDCPEGCTPPTGGMVRETHYTGRMRTIRVNGRVAVTEETETYLKCPTCGRRIDR